MIINVGTSHPRQFWIQAQFFIHCGLVFFMSSGQLLKSALAPEEQPCLPWMPMLLPEVCAELLKSCSTAASGGILPILSMSQRAESPVLKDRTEGTQKLSGPLRFNFLPQGSSRSNRDLQSE